MPDSIIKLIDLNLDIMVKLTRFVNLNRLLNYVNLIRCNIDYQIQHGGI